MTRYLLPVLAFTAAVLAKTDLKGCTSSTSTVTVNPFQGYGDTHETVLWYVPDTLEICGGIDCGGGRAPPRNVPGCPGYSGTETVTPSFLPTTTSTSSDPVTMRTRTIFKVLETTVTVGQASGAKQGNGITMTTTAAAVTSTITTTPAPGESGSETEAAGASSTEVPAGAGPTARAGVAAIIGVAAAVAAFA
ncbi:hypothetical protein CTA2_6196 [Colletotrichum tanaceti]|nr:hypothetical protein CTA2_6196 [Colletotrichum tanaceti]